MTPEPGFRLLRPVGACTGSAPLPLPAEWAERARKEVNETPETAEANLRELRELVLGEANLHSRTDDTFLLAFLRARKHNVGDAFKVLKNFYHLKSKFPKYLEDCLPSEKAFVFDMNGFTILPERDEFGRVLVGVRVEDVDLSRVQAEHFFQQLWTTLQLAIEDPRVQVAGVVILVDLTGFSLRHASIVTPSFARLAMRFLQDSFPVRTRAIHLLYEPFYFDAIYALFRPFIKAKLRNRIILHGSDMKSLHAMVSERALPESLGGCLPDWCTNAFRAGVQHNEDKVREWRQYGYGKKMPPAASSDHAHP